MIALFILLGTLMNSEVSTDIVTATIPRITLETGQNTTLRMQLIVKDGYHIQAHDISDEYLVPTTLDIEPEGFVIEKGFPVGKKLRLEGSEDILDVYDGTIEIAFTLQPAASAQGKSALRAKLRYQACDDKRCFPPRTLEFEIPIDQ